MTIRQYLDGIFAALDASFPDKERQVAKSDVRSAVGVVTHYNQENRPANKSPADQDAG